MQAFVRWLMISIITSLLLVFAYFVWPGRYEYLGKTELSSDTLFWRCNRFTGEMEAWSPTYKSWTKFGNH